MESAHAIASAVSNLAQPPGGRSLRPRARLLRSEAFALFFALRRLATQCDGSTALSLPAAETHHFAPARRMRWLLEAIGEKPD